MDYEEPKLAITETLSQIIKLNQKLATEWKGLSGWAPESAAKLLDESRLDLQVELSRSLELRVSTPKSDYSEATLILAYANLGALVEGSMKWFLSSYAEDYKADADAKRTRKLM